MALTGLPSSRYRLSPTNHCGNMVMAAAGRKREGITLLCNGQRSVRCGRRPVRIADVIHCLPRPTRLTYTGRGKRLLLSMTRLSTAPRPLVWRLFAKSNAGRMSLKSSRMQPLERATFCSQRRPHELWLGLSGVSRFPSVSQTASDFGCTW